MNTQRITQLLEQNDRRGERAIALLQASTAIVVLLLHVVSASRNHWESLNALTISITCCILFSSLVRVRASKLETLRNWFLHYLSVVDGLLIYALILSYSIAHSLPLETTFKSPSVIFLVLYTVVRVMRFDPVPVFVAGVTVLAGWFAILGFVLMNGATLTTSYSEHVTTEKLLLGATVELAVGYLAVVGVLTASMVYARRFVTSTAHVEDLALANRRAEDNLAIYDELLNSSIDGIVIVDRDGTIERVNPALENLFGFSREEMIGENVGMLMSKTNAELLRAAVDTFITTKSSPLIGQIFETQGSHKDGSKLQIELSISDFSASGRQRFAGFMRDIGDRKAAHASEQRALARFEQAVNAAMDAIMVINESGKIVSYNPAAEEIFGYSRSEAIGQQLSELIIPEKYRDAHENGLKHYLKTGEGPVLGNRIEIEGLHADGSELQVELAVKDIDGPKGKLFIGYARDISDRKSAEAELIAAKNSAEVATRAKASFLAMMSHEIRTPLNGVLGIMSLLGDTKLDTDQKELLKTATESGRSLLSIINDILDFSKLEAGKFEIQEQTFHSTKLFDSIVNLITPQVEDKNLIILSNVASDIPEYLIGDADRVRQVVLNLAWNAVKFTEVGEIELKCERVEQENDLHIRVSVRDTGIGIAEEKHQELFSEFATLDSSYASKFGGTGLGLAICKALVSAMGGTIGFESASGSGSTFWFQIPVVEGAVEDMSSNTNVLEEDELREVAGTCILVAEDNATNQLVVSRFLNQLGCKFDIAGDGQEALDALPNRDYDLVLMDVSMPGMDGYEATRQIRILESNLSNIPIVALTAYASVEDRQKLLSGGMDDILPKPVFKNELAKTIARNKQKRSSSEVPVEVAEPPVEQTRFNMEILEAILDGMESEELEHMFIHFSGDLERYLKLSEEAIQKADILALEKASHGLKGVSGTFGAMGLSEKAEQINALCRDSASFENSAAIADATVEMITLTNEIMVAAENLKNEYLEKLQIGS